MLTFMSQKKKKKKHVHIAFKIPISDYKFFDK